MMMSSTKTFKFNKNDILAKLRANLAKHKSEFQELVDKNNRDIAKALATAVSESDGGKAYPNFKWLDDARKVKPEDHTRDYEHMISILEMTTEDILTLNGAEFDCYVNDNWEWTKVFQSYKTMYGMK